VGKLTKKQKIMTQTQIKFYAVDIFISWMFAFQKTFTKLSKLIV